VPRQHSPTPPIAGVHDALRLGLRDYVRKCGFKSVVLGLSGGIDSAVTACLAVAALGK
jgi:NAD+ synthase (glutamine-hydrolysing)